MKIVIYGAAPDDFKLVAHLQKKSQLVLEDKPLSKDNFHSDANVVVIFPDTIFQKDYINTHLIALVSRAVGMDHIKSLNELEKSGIPVLRPVGFATQSVAEYSLNAIAQEISNDYFDTQGKRSRAEIASQKVIIVGAGAIGKRLNTMLASIGCDVALVSSSGAEDTYPYAKLDELVAGADFICLHASLRDVNVKLLGKKLFASTKKSAVLINAARGEMVDNETLLSALEEGKISKAYLDLVADDEFAQEVISHPSVIYTGHTAWRTEAALRKSQRFLVSTLERLIEANQSS